MRQLLYAMTASAALLLSGCARNREQAEYAEIPAFPDLTATTVSTNAAGAEKKTIVTLEEGRRGKVVSSNNNLRFVVLNFPMGQMPALEQRLPIYRGGLRVGEVKITGPQQDDNIVADIATGEAEIGDEVRDK